MIGSGKSTWAREHIKQNSDVKIVAGDDVRYMLNGGDYFYHARTEEVVKQILIANMRVLLDHNYDVILDECYCSLNREMRSHVIKMAGYHHVVAVVFPEKDMQDRIEDKVTKGLRGKSVTYWKRVFREMAAIYEPVAGDEGFTSIVMPRVLLPGGYRDNGRPR
jgi:predicted kinase